MIKTDWFQNKKYQLYSLLLICVLINLNTLSNEYALDDELVIGKNMLVQQGLSGVPKILTSDAYQSFFEYQGANLNLAGGRYRPLSIVSFALEQQLFGETFGKDYLIAKNSLNSLELNGTNVAPINQQRQYLQELETKMNEMTASLSMVRHLFQLFYILICIFLIFKFLNLLWSYETFIPYIATLLFAVHPVHTEVIANLKSRDEIFSLIFILLTCIYFIYYFEQKGLKYLYIALGCFGAAFLSKEYAFGLVVLIPLIYYLKYERNIITILKTKWFLLLLIFSALFLFARWSFAAGAISTKDDVMNQPFLMAASHQVFPSKVAVWLEYIRLLLFPVSLSSDYSYQTFPYSDFSAIKFWLAMFIWLSIIVFALWSIYRRKLIALPLVWMLIFFFMINNFFFEIGATMGERLIFHSSLGFCVLLALVFYELILRSKQQLFKYLSIALLLMIVCGFSVKTIYRNKDWKNNYTLFTKDVLTVPNSAMVNNNVSSEYFKSAFTRFSEKDLSTNDSLLIKPILEQSVKYSSKAIALNPTYVNAYLNRALSNLFLSRLDEAIVDWKKAAALFPGRNAILARQADYLLQKALRYGSNKDYNNAIKLMEAASEMDKFNPSVWSNLGGAYFMVKDYSNAVRCFKSALFLNPNLVDAQNGLNAANANLQAVQ